MTSPLPRPAPGGDSGHGPPAARTGPVLAGRRLNLGCGTDIRPGWVNLDSSSQIPGVDVVHDLESRPFPFADGTMSFVLAQDVLEHLGDPVATLHELHRILEPGGALRIRVPHFTSRNNFIDPTHRNRFSVEWFDFFVRGTPRQRERAYYFDFAFAANSYERITFERNFGWQFYNPWIEWWVNRSRRTRQLYEASPLRAWPADNLVIELRK